jgi:Transglycosylase SLT domain
MNNKKTILRVLPGLFALWVASDSARADIFVYQLPSGARIVTDHALNNRDYRLVRHSRSSKGAGELVSSRKIQYAVTDPNAYDRLIKRLAVANQLDASLVKAVMHVESAFNPHAVSDKGAQGLMQVMPETGQRYGVLDLFDPVQNVRASTLYLKDLQKLFKGNTKLVLAAYNAGENAVLRHRGIPPYQETQDYVRKVTKMHQVYAAEEKAEAERLAAAQPLKLASAETAVPAPATGSVIPVSAPNTAGAAPVEKKL